MAALDGAYMSGDPVFNDPSVSSKEGDGADLAAFPASLNFKMRGWNTVTLDWEVWFASGVPNLVPPVGPCVSVTVAAAWGA